MTEWMDEKPYPGPPSEDYCQYFIQTDIRGSVATNLPGSVPINSIELKDTELTFELRTGNFPPNLPLRQGDKFLFNKLPYAVQYAEYVYSYATAANNCIAYHAWQTNLD